MQAAILPLSAGWFWIVQGYVLFKRQPTAMLFWSVMTTLLVNLGAIIPIVGQIVLVAITPLLTFLTLCACRNLDQGVRMLPGMWLLPLRTPGTTSALWRLGLVYLACTFAAAFLAVLPFWSHILNSVGSQATPDYAALSKALMGPLMVFGALYVVLSALFWHAPALIGWHRLPVRRALFYSMVACWRNKYAFLVYAAIWAAVLYGLNSFLEEMLGSGMSAQALNWIIFPLNILVVALLYCSFYPIYTTIFESSAATEEPPS